MAAQRPVAFARCLWPRPAAGRGQRGQPFVEPRDGSQP